VRGILQMADLSAADPVKLASVYAVLGDFEPAFDCLERGFQGRYRAMLEIAVNPDFSPMRNDPRFTSILHRMKLPV
jgi:hypothetical protein